jgi:hypothetical protein
MEHIRLPRLKIRSYDKLNSEITRTMKKILLSKILDIEKDFTVTEEEKLKDKNRKRENFDITTILDFFQRNLW